LQDYPDFEVIIVDGYSKDNTLDIAKRFADKLLMCKGSLSEARQLSIDSSSGDVLALFDGDIIVPHRRWLLNAVQRLMENPLASTLWPMLSPPQKAPLVSKCYTRLSNAIILDRIRRKRGVIGGTNALFIRKYVEQVGGFNRKLIWGEDFFLAKKLLAAGFKVIIHHDPLYHNTMHTLREFTRKQVKASGIFLNEGFELMGLDISDLMYEHLVIGSKGMLRGLFLDRDVSWSLYPLLLAIRMTAYGVRFLKRST
jgi:glycosyltransferase involved in cell wall biosynthesis